jgi:hypothetical protein
MPKLYLVQFCGSEAVSPAVQGILRGRDTLARVSIGSLPKRPIGLDQTYIQKPKVPYSIHKRPLLDPILKDRLQSNPHQVSTSDPFYYYSPILSQSEDKGRRPIPVLSDQLPDYAILKMKIVVSFGKMSVTCQVVLKM